MASFLQSKCLTTHSHSIDLYSLYNLPSLNFQLYDCTLMMIRLFWCQRNLHKMTGECCSARTIWWISGQLPIQDFRRMVDFSSICSHGTSKGEINSKRQGMFLLNCADRYCHYNGALYTWKWCRKWLKTHPVGPLWLISLCTSLWSTKLGNVWQNCGFWKRHNHMKNEGKPAPGCWWFVSAIIDTN